ncbi:MAG: NADH-quinone oxidoreductase subunit N, partial [Solirubrobacteraceae bacterium]|nr:NADH-quinone oxidoreductase subunit N [Solirubrobacteraceae bacterium]
MIVAASTVATPQFDWNALGPIVALAAGMVVALIVGLFPGNGGKFLAMLTGAAGAIVAIVLSILHWNEPVATQVIADSLVIDRAALAGTIIASASALVGLSIAGRAAGTEDAGHGETSALILGSTLGMAILVSANDLVTVFLGLELLSIPLYVLCASYVDRTASLESGLKYLILGSVGSGTALMGIALIYGATGSMSIPEIGATGGNGELQGLIYPGIALLLAGFGFKLSLAPLHQWTPDVYDGAPTSITAFMSVATKTAALIVTARLLIVAFGTEAQYDLWHPILLVLAAASIVVGNVGALGQPSMKRLMGYSSVAQAGYLVAALAVGNIGAMLAYLTAYAVSTLAVFAVVAAREHERPDLGDDIAALDGLSQERPLLGWIATIGLFGLAGLPLTVGFFGKVVVAGALISASQTWLAVLMIVGSIISLAYYAPPVLRIWRKTPVPLPGAPR